MKQKDRLLKAWQQVHNDLDKFTINLLTTIAMLN
jgi:hypothetical protein